jgi:hypothetical protein
LTGLGELRYSFLQLKVKSILPRQNLWFYVTFVLKLRSDDNLQ